MAAQAHSHEHVHDEGHLHEHEAMTEMDAYVARSYVPARLACLGMGVFFGVIGGVGLSRMGVDFTDVNDSTTQVFGMGMTQLLAMIFVGAGVVSLLAATIGPIARAWMMVLGPIALAAGMIVLVRPSILEDWLTQNRTNGVAYLVAGGFGIATVIGTPVTWMRHGRTRPLTA
jgi:hypothetical protein